MQESLHDIPWPPAYKLRKHRRARSVKISASKKNGLQITIPYRFSLKDIPFILEENKSWVIKQLIALQYKQSAGLPQQISINAINEVWEIEYQEDDRKLKIIQRQDKELVVVGQIQDKALCKEMLVWWLKKQAKIHLTQMLLQVSQEIQLPFKKSSIRNQSTRWGSCTSEKSISLNFKLLFLPSHLVTHIIIHELCHTVFLNHSDKFWNLVAKHDPAWKEHRRAMKQADKFVPDWL